MDRAVRFSLFALGAFIGALLVTFALESKDEPTDPPNLVEGLDDREVVELTLRDRRPGNLDEGNPGRPDMPDMDESDRDVMAEMQANEREVGERRAARIDEFAAREPIDPDWAPGMQRRMTAQFAAHAPDGAKLVSATCKTSVCIAEVEALSGRNSTGQMGWSAMFGIRRGFVMNYETAIEDQYRSVVYMARDGHSLPK